MSKSPQPASDGLGAFAEDNTSKPQTVAYRFGVVAHTSGEMLGETRSLIRQLRHQQALEHARQKLVVEEAYPVALRVARDETNSRENVADQLEKALGSQIEKMESRVQSYNETSLRQGPSVLFNPNTKKKSSREEVRPL